MVKSSSNILTMEQLSADIIAPHLVQIKFPDDVRLSPQNVGIIAYSKFEKKLVSSDVFFGIQYIYTPLSKDLLPGRIAFLRNLFDYLYISPNRASTKLQRVDRALHFTEWFINNGHHSFLEGKDEAISAYVYWTKEIERKIKSGELNWSRKSAASNQTALRIMLQTRFGDDICSNLQQAIYLLKGRRPVKAVRPPNDASDVLQSLIDIANGFSDLVVKEANFPYQMEYQGKKLYIFPNDKGYVKTNHTVFTIDSYDYDKGVVISPESLLSVPVKKRKVQLWTIKDAQVNLQRNNNNKVSQVRLRFADIACCCYLEVFLILTGMHRSEVVQIENFDVLTSNKSEYSNEFRAIKFRAKGKITTYRLHRQGVKALNGYLRLRKWLLRSISDISLNKFFIRVVTLSGKDADTPPFLREVKPDDIGRVYKRLQGKFFPEGMKALTVQEAKRLKNVVLHEHHISPKAIAETLNHSELVNQKIYSNTKTSYQADEMALFWRSVKEAAKQIKVFQVDDMTVKSNTDVSISTGHCLDFKNPVESETEPLIKPNCTTQYGCLYCTKYCCHADEEDIHKLLSLSFVISSLKSKSLYLDEHQDSIAKIHIRVNEILNHVKSSSESALNVYQTIYNKVWVLGELTPFWELRLRRYESMGVVF